MATSVLCAFGLRFFIVFVCHGDLCAVRPNRTEYTFPAVWPTYCPSPRQCLCCCSHAYRCLTFSLRFRYVFDVCALAAPRLVQKDHCPLSTGHKQMWFWLWLGEKHSHGRALHISYTRVRIVFYRFRWCTLRMRYGRVGIVVFIAFIRVYLSFSVGSVGVWKLFFKNFRNVFPTKTIKKIPWRF